MAEQSAHINYSFEDIQRYLQGEMTAAEMHAMEKAALQDAFLADALEGYADVDINTAKQHLNEINAALFTKRKSKVVAFNKKIHWLSVAAIVIVIAGIFLFGFYVLNRSDNKQQIAETKKEPASNKIINDSATATINLASSDTTKKELVIAENRLKSKSNNVTSKKFSKNPIASDKKIQTDQINLATITTSAAPPAAKKETTEAYSASSGLSKESNDSIKQILKEKAGVMEVAPPTVSRKVIDENFSDSVMPVGGWLNFNNYVMQKLNKDTNAVNRANIGNVVEVEFSIDAAGNPYNIKVIKSLNEKYNTIVIEILKTGPKWISLSISRKARVTISF